MFEPDDPAYTGLHINFDETTDCRTCHEEGGIAGKYVVVTDSHNGLTTERSGVIWDGEDTSVTEGAKIAWEITDVADDGTDLTIEGQAKIDMPEGMKALYADVNATRFRRRFSLSNELETDKISAEMKSGELTLYLPKRAEVQPRKIEISGS